MYADYEELFPSGRPKSTANEAAAVDFIQVEMCPANTNIARYIVDYTS